MSQRRVGDDHMPLPEEVAQRIMARAIELDSMHASGTTAAKLREIALEAGVSVEAFDQALIERLHGSIQQVRSFPTADGTRPESETVVVRLWRGVVLNLAVFAGWWLVAAIVLVFLRESIGLKGQADVALVALTMLFGLELSFRMRARMVAVVLAVGAAAEMASLAYTAVFRGAHANPGQMMIAALLGLGLGLVVSRRLDRGSSSSPQPIAGPIDVSPVVAAKPERKPRWPFLQIRLHRPLADSVFLFRGPWWRAKSAT